MTRRCAKCGGDHPIIACPELEAMARRDEAARADRSDRADEIFAGLWEQHGRPYFAASPAMAPFADVLEDLAREWFRRGYSRGGADGAGLVARGIIADVRAAMAAAEGDEKKDQNSGE